MEQEIARNNEDADKLFLPSTKHIEDIITDPPISMENNKAPRISLPIEEYPTVPSFLERLRYCSIEIKGEWWVGGRVAQDGEAFCVSHPRCIFKGDYVLNSPESNTVPHYSQGTGSEFCSHSSVSSPAPCLMSLWALDTVIPTRGVRVNVGSSNKEYVIYTNQSIYRVSSLIKIGPKYSWEEGIFLQFEEI